MIEKKLSQLEDLVQELESETISLDQAMKHYGKALQLASELMSGLTKTQETISVLEKEGEHLFSAFKRDA